MKKLYLFLNLWNIFCVLYVKGGSSGRAGTQKMDRQMGGTAENRAADRGENPAENSADSETG